MRPARLGARVSGLPRPSSHCACEGFLTMPGMGGGQSSTTNSTQVATKTPWDPAIPGLTQSLTDAKTLYDSGVGSQIYQGPRVADFSTDQSAGIQSTRDQAAADNAGGLGTAYLQSVLGSNGISPTTQQGLGMLAAVPEASTARLSGLADRIGDPNNPINTTANAFMNGSRDLTTQPQLQALYDRSQLPSYAETNLSGVARGDYLDPTTNPYMNALVDTSSRNAANAVKEAYAASGRYGSGNFAGATTKAVNDTNTALYAGQYNQERQNQLSANSQIDAARQAASSAGLGITNAISGVQSTNNSQRLAGAGLGQAQQAAQAGVLGQVLGGDQFNSNLGVTKAQGFIGAGQQGLSAANQAAGLLPSVDALRYAPASNLLQVGGLQQAQAQQGLEAAQQLFQEQQQTPWQALSQYASYPLAIGSQGGTQVSQGTQRTETSGVSPMQSILGLGTSLLGLGTGGGATLGGGLIKGLFASDERMKENIRPVGELKDGQTIYSYNYRGEPRTQIGLIAQEVADRKPDAVGPIGLGDLLGVDYGKATDEAARLAAKGRKKGRDGSSGGSAPAALPAEPPRLTIIVRDPSGSDHGGPPAGLGDLLAAMSGDQGGHGAPVGLLAHALQSMIPQEPEPLRTSVTKPQTRGKRRAAA
ncbi:tail fiber domain-containing protein [Methylobacterium sp. E-046]|uniref:tail fiber domain-containing protein n=1 Tax=Methylobacterium sp. E-046 TaxID=2836576 RepID=UPI001FB9F9F5|nr:tail fiber domain-containing protein [Methylobacterium sp. E-046]MCJ2097222.1 tail fiber domain-containing protein [Methylobacterium sp. E-046]